MKKIIFVLFALIICMSLLSSCNTDSDSIDKKHKIEISNSDTLDIVNELKDSYFSGEKVTIQLNTITKHYYALYVNGVKQEPDDSISDDEAYIYYTFTMPNEDVLIEIEYRWVDIPTDSSLLACYTHGYSWIPTLEMSKEQAEFIIEIWNESAWKNDVTEIEYDYVFRDENIIVKYLYDEGIFNDVTNNKHVVLSNEIREQVNNTIDHFLVVPIID